MRRAHNSILKRLSKALHIQHHDITGETLPERWVDLIHYLDDMERKRSEAPMAQAKPRRTNPPSSI